MVTVTRSTSARGLLRAAIQAVARYIPDGVKMISIRPGVSFRFWKECDTPRGTRHAAGGQLERGIPGLEPIVALREWESRPPTHGLDSVSDRGHNP